MMKREITILTTLLFQCLSLTARAEVKDTILNFDEGFLHVENVKVGENSQQQYTKVLYGRKDGFSGYVETAGHPELPLCHYIIPLPNNAEDIKVTYEATYGTSLLLDYEIYPVQHPIPTGINYIQPAFCGADSTVYAEKYPVDLLSVTDISSFGDNGKQVGINICPITYYPQENRCELVKSVSVHLSYSLGKAKQVSREYNPRKSPTTLPFYEYCVITPRRLEDSFTRLIGWERQKGINAGVVCVEDILSDPAIEGDTVSHIYDEAGKIRQYLQYAYKYGGAKYVLFGGNDSIVPIRYGAGRDNTYSFSGDSEALHIPTDFYFAELNSNWNKDNDEFYGEPQDLNDYAAELQVGRLLCIKKEDIENYTDKYLLYETNPGNGDYAYLRKAFYSQADQMQEEHQAELIASDLDNIFPNKTIISEEPGYNAQNTTFPTGNDAISILKEHFGFVSWFNHGHPMTITMKTHGLKSTPYGIGSITGDIPWIEKETCNGLDSIHNKDYPMVAYSVSCSITPFDYYEETYKNKTNIGQSFTLGKDYGGPALIGNTRVGWVGTSYKMQRVFNEYFPNYTIGKALNLAKFSNAYSKHHHALVVNVIGSPDINIWTDIPKKFESIVNDSTFTLTSSPSDGDCMGIYNLSNNLSCIEKIPITTTNTTQIIATNNIVTLRGHNCLPKILPTTIKNITLHGQYHLFTSKVRVGSVEDETGKVIVPQGSNVLFENAETFEIKGNTIIEKGATFAVKNKNTSK